MTSDRWVIVWVFFNMQHYQFKMPDSFCKMNEDTWSFQSEINGRSVDRDYFG